jgi:hypothetical protein
VLMGKTVTRIIGQGKPRRQRRSQAEHRRTNHARHGGSSSTRDNRCHACHREFGVYCAPDEVLRLNEDILLLDVILELLNKLDPNTIHDDQNEAGVTVRRLNFILYAIRNKARTKLVCDYLAGQPPPKPREKPQTMADIWQIFKASLDRKDA